MAKERTLLITAIIGTVLISWAYAANMTFSITFTIPSDKVEAIRVGYLKAKPIPTELTDPNDPNSPMIPTMGAKDWILGNAKDAAREHIRLNYNRGRDQIDKEARIKKEDMFID